MRKLPVHLLRKGTPLYRIHQTAYGPVFYGPADRKKPQYRYDSFAKGFGVLYAGLHRDGAIVETLLRNPNNQLVDYAKIVNYSISVLEASRDLPLAQLHSNGLSKLGLTNEISTGPYDPCGKWADALWEHPDNVDGISYHSRHDPDQICVALFERPNQTQTVGTVSLLSDLNTIKSALRKYGKKIVGLPNP